MEENYKIKYDESKEIEIIYNFYNSQIFRINTKNTNLFLEEGAKFDEECLKRTDELGRVRIIYIADQIQPLSSILKFVSNPFNEVNWGIYAIIVPPDISTLSKIVPLIAYGLNITKLKGRFTLKLFDYSHRNDLSEVIKWMDENMEIKESKIDVKTVDLLKEESNKTPAS